MSTTSGESAKAVKNGNSHAPPPPKGVVALAYAERSPQSPADATFDAWLERAVGAVEGALRTLGRETVRLPIGRNLAAALDEIQRIRPRTIFNLCENRPKEVVREMHLSALFDLVRIPYTGSSPLALGLCQNKALAKAVLREADVRVPISEVVMGPSDLKASVGSPMIVKPLASDGSQGINEKSVAHDIVDARARIAQIIEMFRQPAIVEEFIEGREFRVGLVGGRTPRALPIVEILFPPRPDGTPAILTYQDRWGPLSPGSSTTKCPADLPVPESDRIRRAAQRAYQALGLSGYAGVDLRMDGRGDAYVLDVNPNPDLSPEGVLAQAAAAANMSYPALIAEILEAASDRKPLAAGVAKG
ncbi:MAG: ATP-grasp domain-containing protein [Planctomycetota bacterium]